MITTIIPTYNEEKNIERCVKSIEKYPEISEIIIVDDGSTDKTLDICKTLNVRVIVKDHDKYVRGKSSSMTVGAMYASNDILYVTDADVVSVDIDDAIQTALGGVDVVGITCTIKEDGRTISELESHEYNISLGTIRPWISRNANSLYSVSGAGFLIKRDIVLEYPVPSHIMGEDLYYSVMAHQNGYSITASDSKVCTYSIPSTKALLTQRTRWNIGYFQVVRETGYKRILLDMLPVGYRTAAIGMAISAGSMGRMDLTAIVLGIYLGYETVMAKGNIFTAAKMMVYRQVNFLGYFNMIRERTWKVNR